MSITPPPPPPAATPGPPPDPADSGEGPARPDKKGKGCLFWGVGAAGLVIVLIVIAAIAGSGDEDDSTSSTDTTAALTASTAPEESATTSEAPSTSTTTQPGFGGGVMLVNDEIAPGRYKSSGPGCYWERLSGVGGDFDEIIANGNANGQVIVDIAPADEAFNSSGCDDWVLYSPPLAPATTMGEGDFVVNQQIVPGRYRNDGTGSCYWARLSDFSGDFGGIITNSNADGSTLVEISPSDVGFTSSGCGTWTTVG